MLSQKVEMRRNEKDIMRVRNLQQNISIFTMGKKILLNGTTR